MKLLLRPFRKYAVFAGRSTRAEFWLFAVVYGFETFAANRLDLLDGVRRPIAGRFGTIELITSLVLLLPILSVGTRRLHDTGRSGWWLMILYVPYLGWATARDNRSAEMLSLGGLLVGFVTLTIILLLPGDLKANLYGKPARY